MSKLDDNLGLESFSGWDQGDTLVLCFYDAVFTEEASEKYGVSRIKTLNVDLENCKLELYDDHDKVVSKFDLKITATKTE